MSFINVEIKARTKRLSAIRDYLLNHGAEFIGVDEQTDTYFDVGSGRLKLRQGKIENNLIYYKYNNKKINTPHQEGYLTNFNKTND